MAAKTQSTYPAEELTKGTIASRWFGILGPLGAAFTQQQVSYGFTTWACVHHMPIVLHVPALLALAVVGFGAFVARRVYDRRESATSDADVGNGAAGFFGMTGLFLSAVAAALILAQWLPTLFINPCQR